MAAPAPPRQIVIAKPTPASRQSGTLPAPGAASTHRTPSSAHKGREAKLKVIVRRLAPGLTEQEFRTALGEEWLVGRGKVDWTSYQAGKVVKDAAKPSRPSRAYLHLTSPQHLGPLADKITKTQFIDAKGSSSDSVLLGPPTLVFTPFNKIPGKARADGRQGTIDQDPEFIDFLTSLTHPIVKPANIDTVADKDNKQPEGKIITPLVQFIKDKKANKAKDGKSQKHGRQESKDAKADDKRVAVKGGKGKAAAMPVEKKATASSKAEKTKAESTTKPTKATKSVKNNPTSVPASTNAASDAQTTPSSQPTTTALKPERRRERGNASMAAKILQRDLAIATGAPGRRKRDNPVSNSDSNAPQSANAQDAQKKSPAVTKTANSPAVAVSPAGTATASSAKMQSSSTPVGIGKVPTQNVTTQDAPPVAAKTMSTVSSVATQAFLKHANPSQGVTESLLEDAFKTFGTVTKVEIDKKKGFAYVDFTDPSGLQKAIAASPVKVAQGQVVVLERKTGTTLQNRNARTQQGPANPTPAPARGGRGGGRGRSGRGASNNKAPATTPAVAPKSNPVTAPT